MRSYVLSLIIVISTILAILLLTISCNYSNVYGDYFMNYNAQNHANNNHNTEERFYSTQVIIYKLKRDNFHLFLENTSISTLIEVCESLEPISLESETWYTTYNYTRFLVTRDLQSFLYDDELSVYLSQNGYKEDIKNVAILDIPNMPLTIWVNMNVENVFVTIDNISCDNEYEYELYSWSDFTEKYKGEKGVLVLNGNKIETTIKPIVYHNYADVPFFAVVETLGGKIITCNSNKFFILLNNDIFVLNRKKCSIHKLLKSDNNFFHNIDGGVVFTYSLDEEFMIDSNTLEIVFREMGVNAELNINTNDNVVSLKI